MFKECIILFQYIMQEIKCNIIWKTIKNKNEKQVREKASNRSCVYIL